MIEIIPNWHPIFVHFTVALLAISTLFYCLSLAFKQHPWRAQWISAANWNLWIGTLITLGTVSAGWLAYNSVDHDTPSHVAMTNHKYWALATLFVFIPLAIWAVQQYRQRVEPPFVFVGVLIVATVLLMSTAWRGGELVYRHGLGVMALPSSEGEGHQHDHGDHDHAKKPSSAEHSHDDTEHAPAPIQRRESIDDIDDQHSHDTDTPHDH